MSGELHAVSVGPLSVRPAAALYSHAPFHGRPFTEFYRPFSTNSTFHTRSRAFLLEYEERFAVEKCSFAISLTSLKKLETLDPQWL